MNWWKKSSAAGNGIETVQAADTRSKSVKSWLENYEEYLYKIVLFK